MITTEELGRLVFRVADLPGLDPAGLMVRHGDCGPAICGEVFEDGVNLDGYWPDFDVARLTASMEDSSTADRVDRWLAGRAGLEAGTYRNENVCRCRPPKGPKGDLPLKPSEIENCTPFLQSVIVSMPNLTHIITLGAPANRWFLPEVK